MQNLESLYKKRIADFCDNLIRKQDQSCLKIKFLNIQIEHKIEGVL
jgi:hypothetical protein